MKVVENEGAASNRGEVGVWGEVRGWVGASLEIKGKMRRSLSSVCEIILQPALFLQPLSTELLRFIWSSVTASALVEQVWKMTNSARLRVHGCEDEQC